MGKPREAPIKEKPKARISFSAMSALYFAALQSQ